MDRSRTSLAANICMLALFSIVALTGCDSGTQEPDAPAAEATEFGAAPVPEAAEAASAARPQPGDGSIASDRFPTELPPGFKAEIPATLPSNVPIYPGATPALGSGGNVGSSARAGVQLLSNDSPSQVFDYYKTELEAGGWEIGEAQNSAGMTTISASNGGSDVVIFVQSSADGGSDVFVVTSAEQDN